MTTTEKGSTYSVAVVIVNYCTPELAIDCIESLQSEGEAIPGLRIYIVDNASPDDSAAKISNAISRRSWRDSVTLVSMPRNGGFSYGNNAALRQILSADDPPDFAYLVNPDVIAQRGAIKHLADYMSRDPSIAVAGGALLDTRQEPQVAARRFPSIWSELESAAQLGFLSRILRTKAVPMPIAQAPHTCDWVSGASMMIATRAIRDIGLFDENYFLYFEEVDLCFRAKRAGYAIHHVPTSVVTHIEGAATQITQRKRRGAYWYESRRRYLAKTIGITGLVVADALWGIGRLTFNLRKLTGLARRSVSQNLDPAYFAYDLLAGDVASVISGRIFRERREAGTRP